MSEKNIRLIYTVLQKISKDRSFVEQSFSVWFAQYDPAELLDPDQLITFFENEVGLNQDEKRAFRIAFYSSKTRRLDELAIVPKVLTKILNNQNTAHINQTKNQSKTEDPLSLLNNTEYTFTVFLSNLLSFATKINDDSLVDIIDYFEDKKTLSSLKLTGISTKAILNWIGRDLNEHIVAIDMPEKDMKKIFHHVYISLCESLGPIHADKILSKSIDKTEQNPKTGNYSPSNFI